MIAHAERMVIRLISAAYVLAYLAIVGVPEWEGIEDGDDEARLVPWGIC